jgi:hypothetical protein
MKIAQVIMVWMVLAAANLQAEPLAWMRLGDPDGQTYQEVPYHWLGDTPLRLTVAVRPAPGHALDLLWGCKNDQRAAEINVNGTREILVAGGYTGFQWQRLKLSETIEGEAYQIIFQPAEPKAAFLAAVRLVKADVPLDQPLPEANSHRMEKAKEPLEVWMEDLRADGVDTWERAEIHGQQANEALRRCRRYVDGWLAHADPKTGLIPRNLHANGYFWNGRDAAADNYAFMVLTCALTDRAMFEGRMMDMLQTETKLTSRLGALPADYDFQQQAFRHEEPDLNRLLFDGSEYVKDGLMPITEWLGRTPWSDRMIAIVDSILEHAPVETPRGNIPSDNVEVNGEMMQVLSRLCFMTGEDKYLEMACRIADYYLLGDRHPTIHADQLKLRDHGCELISGLTEVYAASHFSRKDKAEVYREPIHAMLDRILEVGVNEHGLMYDAVNPNSGEVLRNVIGDNWGYNYNGFYTVYLLDGVARYRDSTRRALANLKPHYWKFAWQGWGSDGIADSVEGAINLFNREPNIEGAAEWIDANIARMLLIQKSDGVIEGWHGDGNYARTAIMWVLWKQQGVTVQPWREDVRLGAVRDGDSLQLVLSADRPWEGRLVFDEPRHRTVMQLPMDYPRINQFPEWFTVEADDQWTVEQRERCQVHAGKELIRGLPIAVDGGQTVRLTVRRGG